MGEMSDRVIDAAKETASDALESGKQVAQDAADSAKEQGRTSLRTCRNAPRTRSVVRATRHRRTTGDRAGASESPRPRLVLEPHLREWAFTSPPPGASYFGRRSRQPEAMSPNALFVFPRN